MAKRIKDIRIKKVRLNNKSRKGDYYYIKRKSKRAAYYKIKAGISLDNYLLAYEGKVKIKKRGVLSYTKGSPAKRYLKKIGLKKRKIDTLIEKGISETQPINLIQTNVGQIHIAYKKMLSPLVKDKELIKILALEENVKKFKHRIQATIILKSESEGINIGLKTFNKTLTDIRSDLMNMKNKKGIFQSDIKKLMDKGYKLAYVPEGFELRNYESKILTNKFEDIKVKLRFVKGK